jgi:outer membrane protein OmpA-like peptidoglycan-associated protein
MTKTLRRRIYSIPLKSDLLRLLVLGIWMSGLIGCTTPTTLKPTEDLLQNAEQSFAAAEASESVRYAPDDFLNAKSALSTARSAWKESQSATNLDLKDSRQKAARRAAYEAWLDAEIAAAKAKEARAKEQINQLRNEIAQSQADRQRFEAEAQAAREKRAKEIAESAKSRALQQAQEAQTRAALEQAAKEAALKAQREAEQLALQEASAKEQALQAKQELESRLVSAMQEIAKVREEKRGLIVSLSDILFEFGKATLAKGTKENLTKLGKILTAYPDRQIVVEGHTDNIGGDEFNQQLSLARAQAVEEALIKAGVNSQMINAVGYGKKRPVASNATPEGRQQNRRVEVVVLNPKSPPSPSPSATPPPAPATPAPVPTQP